MAIGALALTTFATQLHQHQLDLGGFLGQQCAEAEGRIFPALEPTWTRHTSAEDNAHRERQGDHHSYYQ